MDLTAVVLHKNALAYYTVTEKESGQLVAHLLSYSGRLSDAPKPFLQLKEGSGTTEALADETELINSIQYAVCQERERRKVVQSASGRETTFLPATNAWSIM